MAQQNNESTWTMWSSRRQPSAGLIERTHERPVPLPLAIDVDAGGHGQSVSRGKIAWECRYVGHGLSKVVYMMTPGMVLKLTEEEDPEPFLCKRLSERCSAVQPAVELCPGIVAIGWCEHKDEWGKPVCSRDRRTSWWFAWIAEYAIPLNRYMLGLLVDRSAEEYAQDRQNCLKLALYKQAVSAQRGFLLSDNQLSNFGVLRRTVVIIDLGSRKLMDEGTISKSDMNYSAIKKWWDKIQWHCDAFDVAYLRGIWQKHWNLCDLAKELCPTRLPILRRRAGDRVWAPADAFSSVSESAQGICESPLANGLLVKDDDTRDHKPFRWLLHQFQGDLAQLKLLPTGETILLDRPEEQPSCIRLETLMNIIQRRREEWIRCPNDILSEQHLQGILSKWRREWRTWMHKDAVEDWWLCPEGKQCEFVRTRFRTFCRQMCGSYELIVFWLRVGATHETLSIFWEEFASKRHNALPDESKIEKLRRTEQNGKLLNAAVDMVRSVKASFIDPRDL